MTNRTVTVDGAKCTGCGNCLQACPQDAIRMNGNIAVIDQARCAACLACVAVCEAQAIVVTETVALAQRPEATVQTANPRTRTIGATLATLGGAALAFVADRILPTVIDRLTQERSVDTPPTTNTTTTTPPAANSVNQTPASGQGRGGGGGGGGMGSGRGRGGGGGRRRRGRNR